MLCKVETSKVNRKRVSAVELGLLGETSWKRRGRLWKGSTRLW